MWDEEIRQLEAKRIIKVRTAEGVRKFGQPIGTIVRTGKDAPGGRGVSIEPPVKGRAARLGKVPKAPKVSREDLKSTVPKTGKGGGKGSGVQTRSTFVHPATGHTMGKTEVGDTFEQLFSAKMKKGLEEHFGCCLKLITGAGGGAARNTPLDFRVGRRGGEVKTLNARATNQKTAIKKEEVERKVLACESLGVEPVLVVQVVDQDAGMVRVYGYPAFASKSVNSMTQLGEYAFDDADFQRAQVAAGHWEKATGRAAAEKEKVGAGTKALPPGDESERVPEPAPGKPKWSAAGEVYDPPDEEGGVIEEGDTVIQLVTVDGEPRPVIWTEGAVGDEQAPDAPSAPVTNRGRRLPPETHPEGKVLNHTTQRAVVVHLEPTQNGEVKAIRRVRTREGVERFDQPVGSVIKPDLMPDRPRAIIFDRDGTLAAVPKRPVNRTTEEWAEFNAALPFDPPAPHVEALLRSIQPGVVRIMVSGRAEGDWPGDRRRRFAMIDWIAKYDLPIDELYMRSGGDMRLDSIVKEEMLVEEILAKYDVVFAVDDRPQVLEVWERHGIPTLQVHNPDEMEFPIAKMWDKLGREE